jgi:predicted esterase
MFNSLHRWFSQLSDSLIPLLLAWTILDLASAPLHGQSPRYELGKRLQRFERQWQKADTEARKQSVRPIEEAVQLFFSLNLPAAAGKLDQAWLKVGNAEADTDTSKLLGCKIHISPRLIEASTKAVQLQVDRFYGATLDVPQSVMLAMEFRPLRSQAIDPYAVVELPLPTLGKSVDLDLPHLEEGDYEVTPVLRWEAKELRWTTLGLSVAKDLEGRLEAVEQTIRQGTGKEEKVAATSMATIELLHGLVKDGKRGRSLESDFPFAQCLQTAEALVGRPDELSETLAATKGESHWVQWRNGKAKLVTRIALPKNFTPSDPSRPLLILLHGAGGSENMFFETYGAGSAVEMARERGWIVAAPRQGVTGLGMPLSRLIESMADALPIDREQVMVMGHSMGSMQAIRQLESSPGTFSKAVLLGGAGLPSQSDTFRGIPLWIAAGDRDFGKRGTDAFAQWCQKESLDHEYHIYPDTEHLVIVQAALQDAFAFLDRGTDPTR